MKPSQDLFFLIQSLSPAEKRYFKLFASLNNKKGINTYQVVFEIIEKQEEYDEKEVIEKGGGEKLARQLPVVKNYLYKLILKSLRNYHTGQSVDFRLKELLMNVEILLRKDLISQCIKLLEKARKTAIQYEKYEYLMEILNYNLSLAVKVSQANLEKLDGQIEETFDEADRYFDKFKNILTHKKLSMQMLILNRKEQHLRSNSSLKAYESLLEHPITEGVGKTQSLKARSYYLQAAYIFHFAKGNYSEAYKCGKDLVELMEENSFLVEERPANYLSAYQNLVTMAGPTQPRKVTLKHIENLQNYAKRFPKIRFDHGLHEKALLFAHYQRLSIFTIAREYDRAGELVEEIKEWLEKNPVKYNMNEGFVLIGMYFNMARVYLFKGEYRNGLKITNEILNHPGLSSGYWMHLNARMLQVIFYLELAEHSLTESAAMSLLRFLEKRKELHKLEKVIIKYVRRWGGVFPGGKESLKILRKMHQDISAFQGNEFEQNAFATFNLVEWIDKKIMDLEAHYA